MFWYFNLRDFFYPKGIVSNFASLWILNKLKKSKKYLILFLIFRYSIYICTRNFTVSGIPVQQEWLTRAFDDVSEYHNKRRILSPLLFKNYEYSDSQRKDLQGWRQGFHRKWNHLRKRKESWGLRGGRERWKENQYFQPIYFFYPIHFFCLNMFV